MTGMQDELLPWKHDQSVDTWTDQGDNVPAVRPNEWYAVDVDGEPVWAFQDEHGNEHFYMPEQTNAGSSVELAVRIGGLGVHAQSGPNMTNQEAAVLSGILGSLQEAVDPGARTQKPSSRSTGRRADSPRSGRTEPSDYTLYNDDESDSSLLKNIDQKVLLKVGKGVGAVIAAWAMVGVGFGVGNTVGHTARRAVAAPFGFVHLDKAANKIAGENPYAFNLNIKHDAGIVVKGPFVGGKRLVERFTD